MNDIYELILNKDIYRILDGDTKLHEQYLIDEELVDISMPYLSGPKICDIAKEFDFVIAYTQNGVNLSRWQYMEQLLSFSIDKNFLNDLLYYFFDKKNFAELYSNYGQSIASQLHNKIVNLAINKINDILYVDDVYIQLKNKTIVINSILEKIEVHSSKVEKKDTLNLNSTYKNLKFHLDNNKYDSAISDSRTLLEEVFCYMIESKNVDNKSNGDLQALFKQVKDTYNLNIDKKMDKSLKKLLSGLNSIVQSIGELRNIAGNSHGIGKAKISVNYAEVRFIMNSTISICDYLLSLVERN